MIRRMVVLFCTLLMVWFMTATCFASVPHYPDQAEITHLEEVQMLGKLGIMVGEDTGEFAPNQPVTRGEMAVILCRLLYGGQPNLDYYAHKNLFSDVPDWVAPYVNLCAGRGIVTGVGGGCYAPEHPVTAAQALLMLCNTLGYFPGKDTTSETWQQDAYTCARSIGILWDGFPLQGEEPLTRDLVAALVYRTIVYPTPKNTTRTAAPASISSTSPHGEVGFFHSSSTISPVNTAPSSSVPACACPVVPFKSR